LGIGGDARLPDRIETRIDVRLAVGSMIVIETYARGRYPEAVDGAAIEVGIQRNPDVLRQLDDVASAEGGLYRRHPSAGVHTSADVQRAFAVEKAHFGPLR